MKFMVMIFSVSFFFSLCFAQKLEEFPALTGEYLGQKPPGLIPELFAPGIISTDDMENNIFFADGGNEIYIERTGTQKSIIYLYKLSESGWLDPVEVKFNDDGGYNQPTYNNKLGILLTGRTIFKENQPPSTEISMRKREGQNWSASQMIVKGIRGSISNDGTVYSTIIDFAKGFFGHIAKYVKKGDTYGEPEFLPECVNDPNYSSDHSLIAPDESFIIFTSKRDGDTNRCLYISFRDADGNWKQAQNLSEVLKTPQSGSEWLAAFSPDGKYLFYNLSGDVYWVDASIINTIKNK